MIDCEVRSYVEFFYFFFINDFGGDVFVIVSQMMSLRGEVSWVSDVGWYII